MVPNSDELDRRTALKHLATAVPAAGLLGASTTASASGGETALHIGAPSGAAGGRYEIQTTSGANVGGSVSSGSSQVHYVGNDSRIEYMLVKGGQFNFDVENPASGTDVRFARVQVRAKTSNDDMSYSLHFVDAGRDEPKECRSCAGHHDTPLLEDNDMTFGQHVFGELTHPDANKDRDNYSTGGQALTSFTLIPRGGEISLRRY